MRRPAFAEATARLEDESTTLGQANQQFFGARIPARIPDRSELFRLTSPHFSLAERNVRPKGSYFSGRSWVSPAPSTDPRIDPNCNRRIVLECAETHSLRRGCSASLRAVGSYDP